MNQFGQPFPPPGFPGPWRARRGGLRVGGIVGLVIFIIMIVIAVMIMTRAASGLNLNVSHKGPCVGGPVMGSNGQPLGHGRYRFPCVDGGSTVVHLGG